MAQLQHLVFRRQVNISFTTNSTQCFLFVTRIIEFPFTGSGTYLRGTNPYASSGFY